LWKTRWSVIRKTGKLAQILSGFPENQVKWGNFTRGIGTNPEAHGKQRAVEKIETALECVRRCGGRIEETFIGRRSPATARQADSASGTGIW
jgi:hypothetical protein